MENQVKAAKAIVNRKERYYICTDKQETDFKRHIDLPQNKRIIFSSKFGNGKTTFLKNIFNNYKDYHTFHLVPVNYSIASNEDIFELIKYDILFELISTKVELKDSIETFTEIAKDFLLNNKDDILKILTPFLSVIPVIGGSLKESTDNLINFSKKALSHFQQKQKGEYDLIADYLEEFTKKKGSIYEENFYTRLIKDLIERLKDTKKGENRKQTVLIIDDFDRIDPEHIFRLLNIFAAHEDFNKQGNKFGFDKVIVVCDIDNIRSIFHHKYGSKTDFNGYIDKFCSVDVFKYSMMEELNAEVEKIVTTIKGDINLDNLFWSNNSTTIIFDTMEWLLKSFVAQGIINVRNVIKLRENKFDFRVYNIGIANKRYFNTQFWGISLFNFIKTVFGDYEEVRLAFEKLKEIPDVISPPPVDNESVLNFLLLPIFSIVQYVQTVNVPLTGMDLKNKLKIELSQQNIGNSAFYPAMSSTTDNSDINHLYKQNINMPLLFHQAFEKAYSKNLLK